MNIAIVDGGTRKAKIERLRNATLDLMPTKSNVRFVWWMTRARYFAKEVVQRTLCKVFHTIAAEFGEVEKILHESGQLSIWPT